MYKIIFYVMVILFSSCNMPIDSSVKENLYIDSYQIDYNENLNEIYIALDIINYEQVYSVITEFYKLDSLYYTFNLNDNGLNGDIILEDGLFSIKENIMNFEYGNYKINSIVVDLYGNAYIETIYKEIKTNDSPEIISIDFPEQHFLDDSLWTSLNFNISIFDQDGIGDIKYVIYYINTDFMYYDNNNPPEPPCDYVENINPDSSNYFFDPTWIMNYTGSLGSNGEYIFEEEIEMRPSNECGGYGTALFQFIVIDEDQNIDQISNISLDIIPCNDIDSDGICDYEDDCIEVILQECWFDLDEDGCYETLDFIETCNCENEGGIETGDDCEE